MTINCLKRSNNSIDSFMISLQSDISSWSCNFISGHLCGYYTLPSATAELSWQLVPKILISDILQYKYKGKHVKKLVNKSNKKD